MLKGVHEIMQLEGVYATNFDFCMLYMKTKDINGKDIPAKKRIKVMTNSQASA